MDTKIRAVPAKVQHRKTGNPEVNPQRFGDLILADHIVLVDPETWGSKGESAGLMIKDQGSGWRDLMPMDSKSKENTKAALMDFIGRRHGKCPGTVHSDRAKEVVASVDELRKEGVCALVHSKATPHRPTSRGAVEREIGVVFEATRSNLFQASFPHFLVASCGEAPMFCLECDR